MEWRRRACAVVGTHKPLITEGALEDCDNYRL